MFETCISFQMDESHFYTPITKIKEIVEIKQITPFPRIIPHYIGMINVRGVLLNILCPYCSGQDSTQKCCDLNTIYKNKKNRILICIAKDNSYFGIVGNTIHKCSLELNGTPNVEIFNVPHKIFDPLQFMERIQGEAL